jgi:hypothetical protein
VEETHALLVINEDIKQNLVVADEDKKKAKKQHDFADAQVVALEKLISDSKQRVNDLT